MHRERAAERTETRGEEDRLRNLGTVAAELLHDLATELAVVDGRIAVARQGLRQGTLPHGELEALAGEAERMRTMVRDVLDHLAGHPVSPEVAFDPETAVRDTVRDWLPGAPSVEVSVSSTLQHGFRVRGRPSFFQRALLNLLRNAARHARGRVAVTLDVDRTGDGVSRLRMEVDDDGKGISRDVAADDLFEPFVAGAGERTGLGLAVVRWCVRGLGGEVEYRGSGKLGGATFALLVPVREAPAGEEGACSPAGGFSNLDGLRLAVVDDDPALRRVYRRLLARVGAEVRPIDPDEPEDLVEELLSNDLDAILLDVNLGVASGVDLWRAVRDRDPQRADRIVLVTGYDPEELGLPRSGLRPRVVSKLAEARELAARLREAATS